MCTDVYSTALQAAADRHLRLLRALEEEQQGLRFEDLRASIAHEFRTMYEALRQQVAACACAYVCVRVRARVRVCV